MSAASLGSAATLLRSLGYEVTEHEYDLYVVDTDTYDYGFVTINECNKFVATGDCGHCSTFARGLNKRLS